MVVAETSLGRLRGDRTDAALVFRGVPYAAPPVGALRWRSPRPAEPWPGTRDATAFGPIAPQQISSTRLAKRGLTLSEDCLSLNVWTPATDGARRPVVVFLHGGGVVAGSGSAPLLDGARLASRGDLVVVTLNFRLGALGSLYAPDRLRVGDDPATNLAFRDQLLALRWVRAEIGAFGGDPEDVTLVGQSSGAIAIACMLAGEAARGLFDRAILQSGGLERVRSADAAADVARRFFAALGDDEVLDLRRRTLAEILAAQDRIPTGFVPPVGPFHHAIDGELIPEHPLVTAAKEPLQPVPILAGTTKHEWRSFDTVLEDAEVTDGMLRERVRSLRGADADVDAILALYRAEHPHGSAVEQRRAVASALVTDFHFGAPTEQFARAHAARGNPVFRYVLDWPSPRPGLGACHDMCLPLVFGTMEAAPSLAGTGREAECMSEIVQDAWIAFVRSNDPSTKTLGEWPAYEPEQRATMLLDSTARVAVRHRDDQMAIWQGAYPASG
jgi:para-nitrobenzyl esterase